MERASGVLMHITSLPGKYGAGVFGKEAKYFIDFLADSGFKYWQTLPLVMTDECNSPYKSYSAFAGNPYFVDPETLCSDGLLTENELSGAAVTDEYRCDYEKLNRERKTLLANAASRADKTLRKKTERFISENPEIEKFCVFMARKAANGEKPWYDWTCDKTDADELFLWQFIQYEFFTQWSDIKKYANEKGIKIIGDIPIYVAYDSCDVWANPEQFDLDKNKYPANVAGCPPDYFSRDGQLWGNPLYNWSYMKKDGYGWWIKRMEHTFNMFDGVRIDHFRAFDSYYAIDSKARDAREGKWKKGPGRDFIRTLRKLSENKLVIAEDLGDITDSVRDLVNYSTFPGMRVFQFAFLGDPNSPHLPHNYIPNSVAYSGTHDNNTLLGYIWELEDGLRRRVLDYCGFEGENWDCKSAYDSVIKTLLRSSSDLVIFPLQDILHYGSDTRMNIPGNPEGNWRFRVTKQQLESINREELFYLNRLYGR